MKKLQYFAISAALLASPLVVFAEDAGTSASASANVNVTTEAPKPRPLQNVGNAIRQVASTTRSLITGERKDYKAMLDDRAATMKTMMGSSTPEERKQVREDFKAALEEKRGEIKDKIEAAKAAAKTRFATSTAIQTSVTNITDHLSKAAADLTNIAERIDQRITELQNGGKDMTASAALLVSARADIAAAQDKITAVGTTLTAALSSSKPKNEMSKVRTAVSDAEKALKTAKDSLHKTLQSVRAEGGAGASAQTQTSAQAN